MMTSLNEAYVQQMGYQQPRTPIVRDFQGMPERKSLFRARLGAFLQAAGQRMADLGRAMQPPSAPGTLQPSA